MRISDWSSDVCSSDLDRDAARAAHDSVREPQVIVARELAEVLARARTVHRNAHKVAARILDRDDARYFGELAHRLGPDVGDGDRKSTRLNSSHSCAPRMPSSA